MKQDFNECEHLKTGAGEPPSGPRRNPLDAVAPFARGAEGVN